MARAVMLGMTLPVGSAGRYVVTLVCLLLAACAGGGKDRSFQLPSGTEFDTTRSSKVLVVVESQNQCDPNNGCVPAPVSPCHLGQGNTRGVAVYRLGTTGLLLGDAASGGTQAVPEQIIATDDNPRRVVVHPHDPTLLYVATRVRVQVIRLKAGGGSTCIDETLSDQEVKPGADDSDPVDMVIDPNFGNGILYVAGRGSNRIDAYSIADDGTLPRLPSSCIVGAGNAEFSALTPMGDTFFAAGGQVRIEVHARIAGQFVPEPDPHASATPTPLATVSPSPAPGETPAPSTGPSPETSPCVNAVLISTPLSSVGAAIVTQLSFSPSASSPLGELFVAEEVSQRIFTFPVNAEGVINDGDDSRTNRVGLYQRMLRRQHAGADLIYASVFDEGRVDVLQLENGLLPNETFSRTAEDPNALPVGLAVDEELTTTLYVAQGGLDRVDGFRIQSNGGLADLPATTTAPVLDAAGRELEIFPDDVVIVPLP